jgi:putative sterol carrier protein
VLQLGRWGAKTLGDPKPGDIVTVDGEVLALRATFNPEAALGVHVGYEVRVAEVVVHAVAEDGRLDAAEGPLPEADLVVVAPEITTLTPLFAGELSPTDAVADGRVRLVGDMAEFERFVGIFGIGATSAVAAS